MEYTISWFIENYSYCWHKNKELLLSPEFFANGLERTAWFLRLYPRGNTTASQGYISLFLERSKVDYGPEKIKLKYEISFLGADGLALASTEYQHTFKKGSNYGRDTFLQMNDLLLRRTADYLPQDTLSVRCKMWMNEEDIHRVGHGTGRTRIGIEHVSFLHVVESFSTLEPNQEKTSKIRSSANYDRAITSHLHLTDNPCCDGKIMVEIASSNTRHILSKCKLFLLDTSGSLKKCGDEDNRSDDGRKEINELTLSLTKKAILERKDEFLPQDQLTILCECYFSIGEKFEKIGKILHEIPSVVLNQIDDTDPDIGKNKVTEKLSSCPSALDDFIALYNAQLLTDVELKTMTKSFPTHKNVLCARSPVFRAMLTNDMKEKNTGCIQVDDLDDDTVENLLHFLYSDRLENLQWDSAIKLYCPADKYDIEKLKLMCSSILLDSLSTSNAIELLLLADTHSDSDLQRAVEDFILKHEEQVFGSEEWGNLIETNPTLVSKTMRLKYKRNI